MTAAQDDRIRHLQQKIRARGGLVLSEVTLSAVQAEATRAHLLHGDRSMLSEGCDEGDRFAILSEETGEAIEEMARGIKLSIAVFGVGHGLTYDQDQSKERRVKELIQVAAMALSWVEVLEG